MLAASAQQPKCSRISPRWRNASVRCRILRWSRNVWSLEYCWAPEVRCRWSRDVPMCACILLGAEVGILKTRSLNCFSTAQLWSISLRDLIVNLPPQALITARLVCLVSADASDCVEKRLICSHVQNRSVYSHFLLSFWPTSKTQGLALRLKCKKPRDELLF